MKYFATFIKKLTSIKINIDCEYSNAILTSKKRVRLISVNIFHWMSKFYWRNFRCRDLLGKQILNYIVKNSTNTETTNHPILTSYKRHAISTCHHNPIRVRCEMNSSLLRLSINEIIIGSLSQSAEQMTWISASLCCTGNIVIMAVR